MEERERLACFEKLLGVMRQHERSLGELIALAHEEQRAILHADYAEIDRVSTRMEAIALEIDELDEKCAELVARIDTGETLAEVAEAAETHGVHSLTRVRRRLRAQAEELRQAQELNARLILEAMRVRERWYALLAGATSPTYGAAGRRQDGYSRGAVSRSA